MLRHLWRLLGRSSRFGTRGDGDMIFSCGMRHDLRWNCQADVRTTSENLLGPADLLADPEPSRNRSEDATYYQIAKVDSPFLSWGFCVVDEHENEMAKIERAFRGIGREVHKKFVILPCLSNQYQDFHRHWYLFPRLVPLSPNMDSRKILGTLRAIEA
jgi:hypothetical protein